LRGNQFSQNDFDLRFAKIPRCLDFEFFNKIGAEQTPGEHDVKPSARSCSGPFDGGSDALGEAAGEGDREIGSAGRDRPADGEGGPPSHHKIIPPADIEERQRPLGTKAIMAVITTGKTNLALPSMRLSETLH
jgi:hypothetical protein